MNLNNKILQGLTEAKAVSLNTALKVIKDNIKAYNPYVDKAYNYEAPKIVKDEITLIAPFKNATFNLKIKSNKKNPNLLDFTLYGQTISFADINEVKAAIGGYFEAAVQFAEAFEIVDKNREEIEKLEAEKKEAGIKILKLMKTKPADIFAFESGFYQG